MSEDTTPIRELESTISSEEARALTDQIKDQLETVWELVKRAYLSGAWYVLGYESWDAYCAAEFTGQQLRIPREQRREIVASLSEAGMSTRQIAAATGLSHMTVSRSTSVTPVTDVDLEGSESDPEVLDAEFVDEDESSESIGINQNIPVWGSLEARAADVVRCDFKPEHIALRTTFEDVGGCPYCMYTPGERQAALQARETLMRRLRNNQIADTVRAEVEQQKQIWVEAAEAERRMAADTAHLEPQLRAQRPYEHAAISVRYAIDTLPLDIDPVQLAVNIPAHSRGNVDRVPEAVDWLTAFLAAYIKETAA